MGTPTLISTHTASDSSSIDITSGIDSTYDEYVFVFTDINPATNAADFGFQVNTSGGSGYNETMTTTSFRTYHAENNSASSFGYISGYDQAEGTAYNIFAGAASNEADHSVGGVLHLFSPANTSLVKHFYGTASYINRYGDPLAYRLDSAGYINTTSAIDEVSFKMSSGNFDGVIQMYGIK